MQLAQMLIPVVSAFVITVMILPLFIGYMRMNKEGQTIREEGPKWHEKKSGTPTMGGVVFILAIIITAVWVGIWQHQFGLTIIISLFIFLLYGILGFVDDFVKVSMKRNLGLRAWQKLLGQLIGAAVFLVFFFRDGFKPDLYVPFLGTVHAAWFYAIFAAIWLIGFSNAVNLTDGLDGLVAGQASIAFAAYAIIAVKMGRTDVLIICLSVIGGLLGFLLFNHKPAKIFMGDAGSLALGGLLATVSLMLHREWSLLLIGIIFVVETASVMLQVTSFRLTGKRIFKMSPIHHHFEMSGWSEWKIDIVFWVIGALGAALYLVLFL